MGSMFVTIKASEINTSDREFNQNGMCPHARKYTTQAQSKPIGWVDP